ncbi:MAG: hypothetical protein FWG55_07610 [Candidatus Bathyarchaeota archaeon]|nr:hypothetical protein [Candidatus Termiticorpusculum sp.]
MKNKKFVICLILSLTIGIVATTPLLMAELRVQPWITKAQGPTAPFTFEVVYANFTITDPDAPITQNSGSRIDYEVIINVTNPSEYRTILHGISFFTAQEIQETTAQAIIDSINTPGSSGGGIEAKGAWVDGVYYNVTCTIPWPSIDENGVVIGNLDEKLNTWKFIDDSGDIRTNENSTIEEMYNAHYYKWIEGVQGYEYTIKDGTNTNKYIYLNMNGKWVDVTGRVTFDKEPEPERVAYSSKGGFSSQFVNYLGSGSKASKENEYDCFFAPGESRLLIISGSVNAHSYEVGIDIIQSGIVQALTRVFSSVDIEFDMEAFVKDNTITVTHSDVAKIQELALTRVGNSYIYNTVLSDNQMFQLDRYGLEVFIVPVE